MGGYEKKEKSQKKRKKQIEPPHSMRIIFFTFCGFFIMSTLYSARLFRSRQFGHGTTTQAQVPNRLHCTRMLRRFLFFNKPLHWSFLLVYKSDICFLVDFSCLFLLLYTSSTTLLLFTEFAKISSIILPLGTAPFHPRQDRGTENVAVASKQEIKTREERVPSETHSLEDLKHHYMNTENTGCQLYLYQTFFFHLSSDQMLCVFFEYPFCHEFSAMLAINVSLCFFRLILHVAHLWKEITFLEAV